MLTQAESHGQRAAAACRAGAAMRRLTPSFVKRLARRAVRGRNPIVLLYHRIADEAEDPWGIVVSPRHFAEQLDVLRRERRVVALSDLVAAVAAGETMRDAAVVTFDDGYADNLHVAKPLLERFAVPATVFVTTGMVGSQSEFWWDALERVCLQRKLPRQLRLAIAGTVQEWELGDEPYSSQGRRWRALVEPPPTARHRVYLALYALLGTLDEEARGEAIGRLQGWAGTPAAARPERRVLTVDELTRLGEGGLVEIGGHGVTHAELPALDPVALAEEVRGSKVALEHWLDRPATSFAYPFGAHDATVETAVAAAGFACACTAQDEIVRPRTDPYRLPRFQVLDWDGTEFERRLQSRFTVS